MELLHFLGLPPLWAIPFIVVLALLLLERKRIRKTFQTQRSSTPISQHKASKTDGQFNIEAYYAITPIPDFNITTEEPLQIRPFKPKYHMTMAIENLPFSSLLPFDNTYSTRIAIRKSLLEQERHEVLACNPRAIPSVLELYTYLTSTYLPTRYPTLFNLTPTHLLNTTLSTSLPLHLSPTQSNADLALHLLGSTIDSEFLLLLPSTDPKDSGKYKLEAYINTFPSGFSTRAKLNMLLSEIHSPVPHYPEKLEKSMDRFFAELQVGRCVKRNNWSVSVGGELFCLAGNHMSAEEHDGTLAKEGDEEEKDEEEVDLRKTVLRCERQTLHRLPGTGALVFAFKTYIYPISDLRNEGSGPVLADAIDGLAKGSVPRIAVYKKQVVWGEKVKAFLRGEIDMDS
ncbi:hypothetical protein NX059_006373 [Plenodomus lindquistii]|nr:hypothetical protein NX059_006373 [Plenodomus lindquistii]